VSTVKKSEAQHGCRLRLEELRPGRTGSPRYRFDSVPAQDGPHGRRRQPDSGGGQLSVNPPVSPGGGSPGQAKNQGDSAAGQRRSSKPPACVGPFPSYEIPMPSKQGVGLDEETPPTSRREHLAQPGEESPIRPTKTWPRHLAPQHSNLVAQYDDLDGQVLLTAPESDQLEHTDEGPNTGRRAPHPIFALGRGFAKVLVSGPGRHSRHPQPKSVYHLAIKWRGPGTELRTPSVRAALTRMGNPLKRRPRSGRWENLHFP